MLSTSINNYGSLEEQIGLRIGEVAGSEHPVDENLVNALLRGVTQSKRVAASTVEELAVKILVAHVKPGLLPDTPTEPEELEAFVSKVVYETFNTSARTMGQRVASRGSGSAYAVLSACTNAIRMHAASEPDETTVSGSRITLNAPAFLAAYAEAGETSGARSVSHGVPGMNLHTQLTSLEFSRRMTMRAQTSPSYSSATDPVRLLERLSGSDVKTISVLDSTSAAGKPVTLTQSVPASVMIGKPDQQMLDSVPPGAVPRVVAWVNTHRHTNGGPDRFERLSIRPGVVDEGYVASVAAYAVDMHMMDENRVRALFPANDAGWIRMLDTARAFHPLATASRGLPAVWPESYFGGKPSAAQVDKYHENAAYKALAQVIVDTAKGVSKPESFGLEVYRAINNVNPVLLASILKAKTDVYEGDWVARTEQPPKGAPVKGAVFVPRKAPRLYYVSSYAMRIVHAVFQAALSEGVRGLHSSSIRRDREGVDETPFGPRLARDDPRRDATRTGYHAGRPVFDIVDTGRVTHCHKVGMTLGGAHLLVAHARRMVQRHGYQVYCGGDDTLVFFAARDRLFTVSLDAARFDRTQNQKWGALDQAVYIAPLRAAGTATTVALASVGEQIFSRMLRPRLSLAYKQLAVRTEGALSGSTCLTEHNGLLAGSVVGYQFGQHLLEIVARLEAAPVSTAGPDGLVPLLDVLRSAVTDFVLQPIASRGGLKFEIEAVDCLYSDAELEERIAHRRDPANQTSVPGGHTKYWVTSVGVGQTCFLGREFILAMDEAEAVGYAAPLLEARFFKMFLDKPVRALDEDADEDVEPNGVAKAVSFLLEGAVFYNDWSITCYNALNKYGGLLTAKASTPEITSALDVDWSLSNGAVAVFPDPGGIVSFSIRRRTRVPMREGATTAAPVAATTLESLGVTAADLDEFASFEAASPAVDYTAAVGRPSPSPPPASPPSLPPPPMLRRPPPVVTTTEPRAPVPVLQPSLAEFRAQAAANKAAMAALPATIPSIVGLMPDSSRRLTREVVVSSAGAPERRMVVPTATFDEVEREAEVIVPRSAFDIVNAAKTGRETGPALTARNRLVAGLADSVEDHPDVFRLHMALLVVARQHGTLLRDPKPHRVLPIEMMWKAMELAGLQGGAPYLRALDAECREKGLLVPSRNPRMVAVAEPYPNTRTGMVENVTYDAQGHRVVARPYTTDPLLNGFLLAVEEKAVARLALDQRHVPTTTVRVVEETAPVYGSGVLKGAGGTTSITVRPPLAPLPKAAPRQRAVRTGARFARGAGAPDADDASDAAYSDDGYDHADFLSVMRGGADAASVDSGSVPEEVPWG